ncbi:hypothetical protein [Natrinema pallidum]|uniref:Uncharacterized protein n=1 Tax=Natrinema pallidum TaxID=69527 RepID=A0A4P9TJT9_9EURY|nr:hypothetical protein [Natrinema pallidum]QCW05239.1 hypothetical protein FGF80_18495 [Natrinema pallidum]
MTTHADPEKIAEHRQQALSMRPETPFSVIVEEIPNNPATGEPYAAATLSKWAWEAESGD